MLQRICANDAEALDLLDQVTQRAQGNPEPSEHNQYTPEDERLNADNIRNYQHGTSKSYALRRLRKDRPDLHAEVIAGKKSPHAVACGNVAPQGRLRAEFWGLWSEGYRSL